MGNHPPLIRANDMTQFLAATKVSWTITQRHNTTTDTR